MVLGLVVVKRQGRHFLLRRGAGEALDSLSDALVKLAPPTVREPLIGRIPNEGIPELAAAVLADLDKASKPVPDAFVEVDISLDRGTQQRSVERCTEDRGVAEHRSVGRREAVDLTGNDGLRPSPGSSLGRPVARTIVRSSKRNECVAADRRAISSTSWAQTGVVGGPAHDLDRGSLAQRAERERQGAATPRSGGTQSMRGC